MNDQELMKQLMIAFAQETDDRLASMMNNFESLQRPDLASQEKRGLIETIYRDAHSLKGAARSIELRHIEAVCQAMESVLQCLKQELLGIDEKFVELYYDFIAVLDEMSVDWTHDPSDSLLKALYSLESKLNDLSQEARDLHISDYQYGIDDTAEQEDLSKPDVPLHDNGSNRKSKKSGEKSAGSGNEENGPSLKQRLSVRLPVDRLDDLLHKGESLIGLKQINDMQSGHLQALEPRFFEASQSLNSIEKDCHILNGELNHRSADDTVCISQYRLRRLLSFVSSTRDFVRNTWSQLEDSRGRQKKNHAQINRLVDDFLHELKKTTIVASSTLLDGFPLLVYGIAREEGKKVDVKLSGRDLEIDRRLLEELRDPMTHVLRNAVNHGIEHPQERESAGKNGTGRIDIIVERIEGNRIAFIVKDDGRGIDFEKVQQRALELGIISAGNSVDLGRNQLTEILFHSGFSTSEIITEISGRGLGLAIVRDRLEGLGGSLEVKSEVGKGTEFHFTLPLSLSTFRGILVGHGNSQFFVPLGSIDRTLRVLRKDLHYARGRMILQIDGEPVPVTDLGAILGIGQVAEEVPHLTLLLLRSGRHNLAVSVDSVLGEKEIMVKPLGPNLSRVRNIAAATILGSGRIVPILNVHDIIKTAHSMPSAQQSVMDQKGKQSGQIRKILIVEDSITSRMLLKNVLEAAGFHVSTAVDGREGHRKIKSEKFDLIVSDVEMPRLDGFELTRAIRSDEATKKLPVILVTSRGSREDLERGVDVGANAYIVKSSFDQSNLIETVQRLI